MSGHIAAITKGVAALRVGGLAKHIVLGVDASSVYTTEIYAR
jgi:hypothetical protein